MKACGCTAQQVARADGWTLFVDVLRVYALLEALSFVARPSGERDALWSIYDGRVRAYLRHCGYEREGQAVSVGGG